ncbi:MAG: sulfotransferase family 2 domain-containing protein [Candidatus Paceibacterota bacterium]
MAKKFPPLVIVDDKQKWAHVSIPKCACSSIRCALEKHFKLEPVEKYKMVHSRTWPHVESMKWIAELDDDWYTWAIIRNPFDRLVSVWQEKCCTPGIRPCLGPQLQRLAGQPFDVFCRTVCNLVQNPPEDEILDTHITPISYFLLYEGKCVAKVIREMHEVGAFWSGLQKRFGFPDLGHLNISIHKPSACYYAPELRRLVEETYNDDLRLWWNK